MPFLAILLGLVILKEKFKFATLIAMCITFLGVLVMVGSEFQAGTITGALFGLLSSLGFAGYTISLRWQPKTPKLTTIILSGFICAVLSFVVLLVLKGQFEWVAQNIECTAWFYYCLRVGML